MKEYNAEADIKKGQKVKATGHYTTFGIPTVVPCADDAKDSIGTAAADAACGENVKISTAGEKAEK